MVDPALDCLLVHVPRRDPDGGLSVLYPAMGLYPMAELLRRHGYRAKILHLGVEQLLDPSFKLSAYLERQPAGVLAFSLHWAYQAADTLRTIREVRQRHPAVPVVLGGFTASCFAEEILKQEPGVDFVLRGDGEQPLLALVTELQRRDPCWERVPNLVRRDGPALIASETSYVASGEDLDGLAFSSFQTMEHFATCCRLPLRVLGGVRLEELPRTPATCFLCLGRGCTVSCSFCGGGREAQQLLANRRGVVLRSPDRVVESMRDALEQGIERFYASFDPLPDRGPALELFRRVGEAGLATSLVYECWSLPTPQLMDAFAATFGGGRFSKLILSPETGSESLRARHRGFSHGNAELLEVVDGLRRRRIPTELFFGYPLPFEQLRDVQQTERLIVELRRAGGPFVRCYVQPYTFDPASPQHLRPKEYGLRRTRPGFAGFCGGSTDGPASRRCDLGEQEQQQLYAGWQRLRAIEELKEILRQGLGRGDLAGTLTTARRLAGLVPDDAGTQLLLGACLQRSGEHAEAIDVARRALQLDGESEEALLLLASSCERCGRLAEARGCYEQGATRFPAQGAFLLGLSRVLFAAGEHGWAIQAAKRGRELLAQQDSAAARTGDDPPAGEEGEAGPAVGEPAAVAEPGESG